MRHFPNFIAPTVPKFDQAHQEAQAIAEVQDSENDGKEEGRRLKGDAFYEGSPGGGEKVDKRNGEGKVKDGGWKMEDGG